MRCFLLLIGVACAAEKVKFKAPEQSEEERLSPRLPTVHRCDGCKAIAFQLYEAVSKQKHLFSKRVLEEDALDIVDAACDATTYLRYGIVHIEGKNTLNGPGIVSDKVREGIMQMNGGLWPSRLSIRCLELTGTRGEVKVVRSALESAPFDFWKSMCTTDCEATYKQEL